MDKRADYLARHRLGLPTSETKLSLGKHLDGWLVSKRRSVAPSTWVGYDIHVRHLRPLWHIALPKLTPNDIRRHLTTLADAGLSPNSVKHNLTVLRMALGQAVADGLVARNVAQLVESPRVERREPTILSPLEIRRFLTAAAADPLGPLWKTYLGTGLRLGEGLALRRSDIDLVTGTLTVTGSLRPIDRRLRKPGQKRLSREAPKTDAGRRTIALPPTVIEALRGALPGIRATVTAKGAVTLSNTKAVSAAGYIFTSPRGGPLDPRNVSRAWHAFLTGNKLRVMRTHDLRHTAASLMLASGASLDDVKRYLGHSNIAVTSDLYGHLVEGRSAEVAGGIERALGRRG